MNRAPREIDVEKFLKTETERRGGRAIKLKFVGYIGAPDRLILLPGRRIGFLELKHPNGKGIVSPQQRYWITELESFGIPVGVAHNALEVVQFLERMEGM